MGAKKHVKCVVWSLLLLKKEFNEEINGKIQKKIAVQLGEKGLEGKFEGNFV